jgi:hypothetical protein
MNGFEDMCWNVSGLINAFKVASLHLARMNGSGLILEYNMLITHVFRVVPISIDRRGFCGSMSEQRGTTCLRRKGIYERTEISGNIERRGGAERVVRYFPASCSKEP